MDHNNNPPLTSSDPFDYDPISLDDELLNFINSVVSPTTPQIINDDNNNVSELVLENQTQNRDNTPLMNNDSSNQGSQLEAIPPQHKKAEKEGKKKPSAIETERKRRQVMSNLYQDLRSILPAEYVKRKRSTSDLLQEATNYITHLEEGIKELNVRKKKLSAITRSTESSSSSDTHNNSKHQQNYHVTIKPCKEGFIEIIIGTNAKYENTDNNSSQSLPLSKVLNVLSEEGLNVINCISSRIDDDL
ncbi:Transcription factor bHLH36, partial [Bienertia sinuspersici]